MNKNIPAIIFKGLTFGALIGLLIGIVVLFISDRENPVVRRPDYKHVVFFEKDDAYFAKIVTVSFILVFAYIGPYVAGSTFNPQVRPALYGLFGCLLLVTLIAFPILASGPESKSDDHHTKWSSFIYHSVVPMALIIGPFVGIYLNKWLNPKETVLITKENIIKIIKGAFGGAFVGFFTGGFILLFSVRNVFEIDEMHTYVLLENAEWRFFWSFILAFMVVFAVTGSFLSFAKFGKWLDSAIYGFLISLVLIVIFTFVVAVVSPLHPTYYYSFKIWTFKSGKIGIITALFIGPPIGILVGNKIRARKSNPDN